MSTDDIPPIQRIYDLADLSEAGDEIAIRAAAGELPLLAEWAQVDRMDRFEALVTLRRLSPNRFRYDAELNADFEQTCVVSLQPVPTRLKRHFSRVLQLRPRAHRQREEEAEAVGLLTLSAGDDEVPEELDSPRYDLAAPLLEELLLAIDPYPRAEGVEFARSDEAPEVRESPFAALKRLKEKGG